MQGLPRLSRLIGVLPTSEMSLSSAFPLLCWSQRCLKGSLWLIQCMIFCRRQHG